MDKNSLAQTHEGRKFLRQPYHDRVYIKTDEVEQAETIDLCDGGISISTDKPLHVGDLLEVLLLDKSVAIEGRVVSSHDAPHHKHRVGVQFDHQESEIVEVALHHAE